LVKKSGSKSNQFRLENHLLLLGFLASRLGMEKASDFQRFREVPEGFDSNGRSFMFHAIITQPGVTFSEDRLIQYDDNIREYASNLSKNRNKSISLRYFQYLAALFSEIYLNMYFQNPISFLNELNKYTESKLNEKAQLNIQSPNISYARNDLRKIAFWMATGSGKTFLMHINYWQFQKYNKGDHKIDFDNIILITPTSDLSKQHLEELKASNIPAELFQGESRGYFFNEEEEKSRVKVIDIYKLKLTQDKKGEGVTIDVSCFGGKNLIFVDEGHKGHASEDRKWKDIRKRLSEKGFTFEYSATFGQAINSSSDSDFKEYAKAILFDYSYKFFFGDGFGKDFHILNLSSHTFTENLTDTLLLSNAISFYEQKEVFASIQNEIKDYNIEPPLWIFVGHKVQEDTDYLLDPKKPKSDILKVLQFFSRLIKNKDNWALKTIDKILQGKSGLLDENGNDVFALQYSESNFTWLRSGRYTPEQILNGIFLSVFHITPGSHSGKLLLVDIKNAEDEIGLKVDGSNKMFGVIKIGDKSGFIKPIEEKEEDIHVVPDAIETSLFDKIDKSDSPIDILIGAKKFIEGWNSWRVSNMGLMNVGKNEGAQIIQLFGRGVRLKGLGVSLKRSRALTPPHPAFLDILETLNIFGIEASYMEFFRKSIENEDVAFQEIILKTKAFEPFPENLHILRVNKPPESFKREKSFFFAKDDKIQVKLDLMPKMNVVDSREVNAIVNEGNSLNPKTIDERFICVLDWNEIYTSLLKFKNEKGWSNILVTKENLRKILTQNNYELLCNDDLLKPSKFADLQKVQEVVVLILKKYLERSYSKNRNIWEKDNIELARLEKDDEMLNRSYIIKVKESEPTIIDHIRKLKDSGQIYTSACIPELPNICFDKHLYQPLFASKNGKVITTPIGLNPGEKEFIEDLKKYLTSNTSLFKDKTLFILRNLTKGKGIGFFETHRFYPDFIFWVINGNKQSINFIDPKGLVFVECDDQKLNLYAYLKNEIEIKINDPNISLNAFIISNTPFETFKKRRSRIHSPQSKFEGKHILFQYKKDKIQDTEYINKMFNMILGNEKS
jgi:hypothetical protein